MRVHASIHPSGSLGRFCESLLEEEEQERERFSGLGSKSAVWEFEMGRSPELREERLCLGAIFATAPDGDVKATGTEVVEDGTVDVDAEEANEET